METESAARPSNRPRPWLLVALALVGGVAMATEFWPTNPAATSATQSNPPRARPNQPGKSEKVDPNELDVHIEALKQPRPQAQETDRNPFKFYVKPAPPPPPAPVTRPPVTGPPATDPTAPPPPPPVPPIPLKFIGIVERRSEKFAAFSDCKGSTTYGREGGIVAGQYRLVRIGVESVTMEYLDGRGRTTIRLSGQDCIGK